MRLARVGVIALLASTGVLAGCSGDDESSFEPKGEIGSAETGGSGPERTVVHVDTGKWSDAVMVPTLVDYLEARQESMRERRITPAMVETATFQWIQRQRAVIADAKERGWTVPDEARMRIVGVRDRGADAIVRLCMWGPSVDFIEVDTGRPVRPEKRQWYPFDVKMVQAGEHWYVSAAAQGKFSCEVDEG